MDWSASTWWWVAAGGLVAVELATGTFYLLMLALGAGAAALSAHAGAGTPVQLIVAALVGGGAVAAWHVRRVRASAAAPSISANRDVNLDIGERVAVTRWDAEGETRVQYRGASWAARFGGSGTPAPGPHVIRAVEGSHLVLEPVAH